MKYRTAWTLAAVLLVSVGSAQAAEEAEMNPVDPATSAVSVDGECEEQGYTHDHRRQKGLPSGGPRCVPEEDAESESEKVGHDHRKQHKQQ